MIIFKDKLNDQNIDLAFDLKYNKDSLVFKNNKSFDFKTYKDKIQNTIKKFDNELFKKYKSKNNDIACLAILNYFTDEIPELYSIKFEDNSEESIYYKDEL